MNLDGLNDMQKRAVKRTEGPLLIIAGAGSGKTRVLTNRIAYLIEECGVNPYNILAITFTNKAAAEMKERVEKQVDCGGQIWVSTFHSTCVRILRRYIDRLGYDNNFTIYDTDDQKSVIKDACKKLNIDTKMLKERTIMSAISSAKDEMVTPDEMEINAGSDYNLKRIANVYREYQKTLKVNNALDFDDLLFKTVELFVQDEDVLNAYQERFKYIMVDEYQDTNTVQFKFVSMLAEKYGNLCVVGDDDQSIYKFRGANIANILNFENTFINAKVIKLEQNYRSTQRILDAANAVIKNNVGRKQKALWTENGEGDKINFSLYETEYKEADGVVESICAKVREGWNYNDIAVLYRTNAQSRVLEEKLIYRNVPYRIYGGVNFYQRKEIKDILAYLKTIDNGMDSQAVKRIINVPRRGIGATTIERIQEYADLHDISFWDALCQASDIPDIGRALGKLEAFVTMILGFKAKLQYISLQELADTIISDIGYYEYLAENETKDEVAQRQENIDELINKIVAFEEDEENENKSLSEFLSEVALIADIDNLDESGNQVMLMTLHSAKGLEFPIVYMTGLEDGLFPSYMTIVSDDPTDIEEERRLCYVGITRAKKELTISSAKQRMVRGETQMNKVSRFVNEIPKELLEITNQATGYNKSKISFGGEETEEASSRFNIRANAKAALNRYGSGNVDYNSQSKRVRIEGKPIPKTNYGMYAGGTTNYSNPANNRTSTNYGSAINVRSSTNYGGAVSSGSSMSHNGTVNARSSTNYSTAVNSEVVKAVSKAPVNKKVGFGKEFPMDIFDIKKKPPVSASAISNSGLSEKASKLGYEVGDTVSHVKFGTGIVKSIEASTKDYMVSVYFDDYGMKKMLAGFAKLKKE